MKTTIFGTPMPLQFQELPLDQSEWPDVKIGGWEPGNIACSCFLCRKPYVGAKMSSYCYPCAALTVKNTETANARRKQIVA